jgi:glycosyltransferase involved in cell wall biosynthesis
MGNKPMKVLMAHNYYQSSSPSGEDGVFKNEIELLRNNGVNVVTYKKHNDKINDYGLGGKLLLPFNNIWSTRTYREIKEVIRKEKPDIAHFHNIFYLISPSAYYACREAGVPVVQTLHNFRFFCINGLLMRNGQVCEECIGKSPWKGVKYGCYRDSQIYSFPIGLADAIHRSFGTWKNKIDAFIALTEFGKKKFIECGLPQEKLFVKPNFLPNPPAANYSHKGYAAFIGRISIEKGINSLINAFNMLRLNSINQLSLKIIGDGPLKDNYEDIVQTGKINNIEFTGRKGFDEAMELLRNAQFMVMSSIWYEGFPMVIREAFACGKPVIASRLGAMAELVEDGKTGLLFDPGNPVDLAAKMKWMIEHEAECIEMGKNARKVFEEKYTAERNFQILMNIYKEVLNPASTYTPEV